MNSNNDIVDKHEATEDIPKQTKTKIGNYRVKFAFYYTQSLTQHDDPMASPP